jgi:hypothetical protein
MIADDEPVEISVRTIPSAKSTSANSLKQGTIGITANGRMAIAGEVLSDPVKDYIANFKPPAGWIRDAEISGRSLTSGIYSWVIACERDPSFASYNDLPKDEKSVRRFYCAATKECRERQSLIMMKGSTTSGANDHLKNKAHVRAGVLLISEKSAAVAENKEKQKAVVDRVTAAKDSRAFKQDPKRYYCVQAVRLLVVGQLVPFSFYETEHVKEHAKISYVSDFPIERLHHKAVRQLILEMYLHCTSLMRAEIAPVLQEPIPMVHANIDLWKSKLSKDCYIGAW